MYSLTQCLQYSILLKKQSAETRKDDAQPYGYGYDIYIYI
jgi:hypothetical protein